MIQEDYVSFETAKLLKENGFNIYPLFPCYREDNGKFIDIPTTLDTINYCFIPAPTLQMAMKWLREVHNFYVYICPRVEEEYWNNTWNAYVCKLMNKYPFQQFIGVFNTYSEACETTIKYCLENLI